MGDNGGVAVLLVICLLGAICLGFFIREEVIEHEPNLDQTATIQSVISGIFTQTALAAEINSLHLSQTAVAAPRSPTPSPTLTPTLTPSPGAIVQATESGGDNRNNTLIIMEPGGGTGGKNDSKAWANLQRISFLVLLFIPCYLAYAFGKQRIHTAEARKIKEKRRMMELEASIRMQMLRIQHEGRRRSDHVSDSSPQAFMEDDPCS